MKNFNELDIVAGGACKMTDGEWFNTDYNSRRVSKRFAFLPVRTVDNGWVWFKSYWLRETIYGWGFHDKHPYLSRESFK